tara:strand:+ start:379 stop:756 length:378 start_codon:yes stop_codon:yes gene_type:complete
LIINLLKSYVYLEDKTTMMGEPVPTKPSAALDWIGILVIIAGFFLAVGSIRFTGWFVPTNLERVYLICGVSLLVGSIPILWNDMLKRKYSKAFEDRNGKKKWASWQIFLFFLAINLVTLIASILS